MNAVTASFEAWEDNLPTAEQKARVHFAAFFQDRPFEIRTVDAHPMMQMNGSVLCWRVTFEAVAS